jgi:hypothetical protein
MVTIGHGSVSVLSFVYDFVVCVRVFVYCVWVSVDSKERVLRNSCSQMCFMSVCW